MATNEPKSLPTAVPQFKRDEPNIGYSLKGRVGFWCIIALVFGLHLECAWAQPVTQPQVAPATPTAPPLPAEILDFAKAAQARILKTQDGVTLKANYWLPKPDPNRPNLPPESRPVAVLCHSLGKTQAEMYPLANELLKLDFAVVTFDWRGHGESKTVEPGIYQSPRSRANAAQIEVEQEFRTGRDFLQMVYDLEAIKQFLLNENNAHNLNVREMCLLTAGDMSSTIALYWIQTVEFRYLGPMTGADLANLTMISPTANFRGINVVNELPPEAGPLPIWIVSADYGPGFNDAKKLANKLRIPDLSDPNWAKGRDENYYRASSGWIQVPLRDFLKQTKISPPSGVDLIMIPQFNKQRSDMYGGLQKYRLQGSKRLWQERDNLDLIRIRP